MAKIAKDPPPGVSAEFSGDNVLEWDALICGPGETCFEGGTFRLKLMFPLNYPQKSPEVWFYSRMFHPNVYPNGKICLDILEMEEKWSPDYDAAAVLCAIQAMLGDPNPESPANGEANQLFSNNRKEYERRVRAIVEMSEDDGEAELEVNGRPINLNKEDQRDEVRERLAELDLSEFGTDTEQIRQFLSN